MQVFINISSKVAFILKSYVRQPSRVYQNLHGVPFPPRSPLLPRTGSNKLQFLHSAEVRHFTHERSQLCWTSELQVRSHFLGVRPRLRPKLITAFSATLHVSLVYASPPIELRQWQYIPFRCRNYRGTLRSPTHMLHILYELPYNMHATSDNSHDPHIQLHARGKRYS